MQNVARAPFFLAARKTRAQWLSEYAEPWRSLMATIQEGPKEIADKTGFCRATVVRILKNIGEPGRRPYRTYQKVIVAILSFRSEEVRWEDAQLEAEHAYDVLSGRTPHEPSWRSPASPKLCRLCSVNRRTQVAVSLRKQAAVVKEIRRLAKQHGLQAGEWAVVSTALNPRTETAAALAMSLNSIGEEALASMILTPK